MRAGITGGIRRSLLRLLFGQKLLERLDGTAIDEQLQTSG
jgi:hypothetical protein